MQLPPENKKEEIVDEEVLNSLDNNLLLGLVNEYLPENQKVNFESNSQLIPEAKKLFLNLQQVPSLKREINLSTDFFNESKKDLIRSRKAYGDKDYPSSIYHLQQSAEKVMKSFGLAQGVFSIKDLYDIKHQTPKAFIKLIEEKKIQFFLQSLKTMHPDLNTNIKGLQTVIDNKDKELALLSREQIQNWLNLGQKIDEALSKNDIDSILKPILPALAKAQGRDISYPPFSIIKFGSVFIKMYLVAAITYPHESYTRYPGKEINPSQYDENLGIVQTAPQIFEILEEALDFLDKFIQWKVDNKYNENNYSNQNLKNGL